MSTASVVMMIVSMLILWGGLAAAILALIRADRGSAPPTDEVFRDL